MTEVPPTRLRNMATCTPTNPDCRHPVGRLLMASLIAFFVVVGYVQSLGFGLWLDDHAHFLHLRERGWGYRDAIEEAYLAIPGEVSDCWGRTEPPIRFYRPVAFTLMKIEYHIAHWRPAIMHGFSLLWHFGVAFLVGTLATRFFGSRTWGTVAGCLMAIHPAHVGTVVWIACQTELMTTTFQLLAILAYSRHARWGERFVYPDDLPNRENRPWLTGRLAPAAPLSAGLLAKPEPRFTPAIGVCLFFFMLALGCRENAVMFPIVCWLGDRLLGAGRRGLIRWEHVTMVLAAAVYVVIRHMALGQSGAPTWADLMNLTRGNFALFLFQKTSLYLLGIFCYVPTIPIISSEYAKTYWPLFYGTIAILFLVFFAAWRSAGRGRALLWPFIAIFVFMAPTVPIYASAHHLYLPSVAGVLLITTIMALIGGVTLSKAKRLSSLRKVILISMIIVHVVGLSTLTLWRGYLFGTMTLTEDVIINDVITRSPEPVKSGDHLFFIDMPVLAYYTPCAVRNERNLSSLNGHVLMYSPYLTRMEAPATLQVVDSHRLRLSAPRNETFLGGDAGKTILSVLKLATPKTGATYKNSLYTVNIIDADEQGVREVEYVFDKPLTSPEYHFYFGSPQFLAYPIDVSKPTVTASQPAR
jgi:hypothetical protein